MAHSPDISLQPNEKIVLVLHRHWLGFIKTTVIFLLLAALPTVIFLILRENGRWLLETGTPGYIATVMAGTGYAFFWLVLFYGFWLDFALDYYIVTNLRIIDVHQSGLFDRTIAVEYLTRIQDVTSVVRGLIPTIVNYGHVYIQTAGERQRFVFHQVPRPTQVEATIMELAGKSRAHHDASAHALEE